LGARLFHWFSNKQILKFETVYIDCGSWILYIYRCQIYQ
jgi:hypothetical protein